MKKFLLALAATAAFTGSAVAADMAPRTYSKAPPMTAPVTTWTGCYVGGGGGYGFSNNEIDYYTAPAPGVARTFVARGGNSGGRGAFGTVQVGCDYQFAFAGFGMVIGAFGDYDFSDIRGDRLSLAGAGIANDKLRDSWAAGGRLGVLVTPNLLTYVSGGYTEARFDQQNFTGFAPPFVSTNIYLPGQTHHGYFIGAGDEYALGFLPGLFWKTEYRFSEFDTRSNTYFNSTTNLTTGVSEDSKRYVHTIRSELVYRFNWGGGPLVAKY